MKDELQQKFDRMSIELKERQRHYRDSLRNVLWFCIIILFFFSLYSALLSYKIREVATPSTIALLIAGQLKGHFSDQRTQDRRAFRRIAENMTDSVMLSLPAGILAGNEMLKDSMRADARAAAQEIASRLSGPLRRNLGRITEESTAQLADRILSETGIEPLTAPERTLMFPVPFRFGERLREIRSKNGRELTRQDLCDRDFMICWLYLRENDRYLDSRCSPLTGLSVLFAGSWEDVGRSIAPPAQKNTKNSPASKAEAARQ